MMHTTSMQPLGCKFIVFSLMGKISVYSVRNILLCIHFSICVCNLALLCTTTTWCVSHITVYSTACLPMTWTEVPSKCLQEIFSWPIRPIKDLLKYSWVPGTWLSVGWLMDRLYYHSNYTTTTQLYLYFIVEMLG